MNFFTFRIPMVNQYYFRQRYKWQVEHCQGNAKRNLSIDGQPVQKIEQWTKTVVFWIDHQPFSITGSLHWNQKPVFHFTINKYINLSLCWRINLKRDNFYSLVNPFSYQTIKTDDGTEIWKCIGITKIIFVISAVSL